MKKLVCLLILVCVFSVLPDISQAQIVPERSRYWKSSEFDTDDADDVRLPDGTTGMKMRFADGITRYFTKAQYDALVAQDNNRWEAFLRNSNATTFQNLSEAQKVDVAHHYLVGGTFYLDDTTLAANAQVIGLAQRYLGSLSAEQLHQLATESLQSELSPDFLESKEGFYVLPQDWAQKLEQKLPAQQNLLAMATGGLTQNKIAYFCDSLQSLHHGANLVNSSHAVKLWWISNLIESSGDGGQVLEAPCEIKLNIQVDERTAVRKVSIREAIELRKKELEKSDAHEWVIFKKYAKTAVSQQISRPRLHSKCSLQELGVIFAPSYNQLKNSEGAVTSLVSNDVGTCRIEGRARKARSGQMTFTIGFFQSPKQSLTIPFSSLADLAQQIFNLQVK